MSETLLIQSSVPPYVQTALLVAGPGTSITYGSGTITLGVSGGGFSWVNVTSADNPVNLVAGTSYVASGALPVAFFLPPAAGLGDAYQIVGNGNLWSLAQNAGQSVVLGNVSNTPGVFGNVTATMISDAITIVCIQANILFTIRSPQGNPTLN